MPRDGSLTPADLIGKLDWLVVCYDKCGRHGRYTVTVDQSVRTGALDRMLATAADSVKPKRKVMPRKNSSYIKT